MKVMEKARDRLLQLATFALLALLLELVAPSAFANCKLKTLDLPVTMVGRRPVVKLGLNGVQVPLVLDTGAFYSMLTEPAAALLGLKTRPAAEGVRVGGLTGAIDMRVATVDKVQIGPGELSNVEFLVGVSELGANAMGVLGRNFLGKADSEYDLAHGIVRLVVPEGNCSDDDLTYWAGDSNVSTTEIVSAPGQAGSPPFLVEVAMNGHEMRSLLDTGAPESSVTVAAAKSADIEIPDTPPAGFVRGGGRGAAKYWVAHVASYQIGSEEVNNSLIKVLDVHGTPQDAILGVDYFLSHHIFVSNNRHRIYATYNGGAVFARNGVGQNVPLGPSPTQQARDQLGSDPDNLIRQGSAAASRGDFGQAVVYLDRACAIIPLSSECFSVRAGVHLAAKQQKLALQDLDESLRLDASNLTARLKRVQLRLANGDRSGGLEDLHELDDGLPAESDLRTEMAEAYASQDIGDGALRQWDLWISAHPHDGALGDVLYQRCWLRVRLNVGIDQAVADCRAAVASNPEQGRFHEGLGWALLRQTRYPAALKEFDVAVQLRPSSPWSFYGRAITHEMSGDDAGAQSDLTRSRALDSHIDVEASRYLMETSFGPKP